MEREIYAPESWGWKQDCYAAWSALLDETPGARALASARVTGRERHEFELVCPDFRGRPLFENTPAMVGRFSGARVSGRFEYGAAGPADFPAPGDWVLVDGDSGSPRIQGVLPRRSALSRARTGTVADEQVLASNVDVIFLVFALDGGRNFLLRFLERALVVAKNSGAACCVVLNKADLATAEERERSLDEARRAAPYANVIALSAKTGEGLEGLSAAISPGETGCMLGKSGVGKSALVNALASNAALGRSTAMSASAALSENAVLCENAAVYGDAAPSRDAPLAREGRVREDDLRGRHTTTSSRLYRLDSGILLIDSPGIRELKLWGDADGLEGGFPEIAEIARRCRFADCAHEGEPGCAVQEALNSGALDQRRYLAYLELAKEQAWVERRNDDRAKRENDQKWKQISKLQKEIKKERR